MGKGFDVAPSALGCMHRPQCFGPVHALLWGMLASDPEPSAPVLTACRVDEALSLGKAPPLVCHAPARWPCCEQLQEALGDFKP